MSLGFSMCGASEEGMAAVMGQRSGKTSSQSVGNWFRRRNVRALTVTS